MSSGRARTGRLPGKPRTADACCMATARCRQPSRRARQRRSSPPLTFPRRCARCAAAEAHNCRSFSAAGPRHPHVSWATGHTCLPPAGGYRSRFSASALLAAEAAVCSAAGLYLAARGCRTVTSRSAHGTLAERASKSRIASSSSSSVEAPQTSHGAAGRSHVVPLRLHGPQCHF